MPSLKRGGGWERDVILHRDGSVKIQRGGIFSDGQELRCSDYTHPDELPGRLQRPMETAPPLYEKAR